MLLDPELSTSIKRFGRERGYTLFMTLLAANLFLLHRLSNQADMVISVPTSGRTMDCAENMVGYCTHLLPIRSRFDGSKTVEEHFLQVKRMMLDAFEHQDYPFANLISRLREEKSIAIEVLTAITVNLDRPMNLPNFMGLESSLHPDPIEFTAFDLSFNVIDLGDALAVDLDYDTDIFQDSTAKVILQCYKTLLEGIISVPATTLLTKLPLLSAEERRRVL